MLFFGYVVNEIFALLGCYAAFTNYIIFLLGGNMHGINDKNGFKEQAEQWRRENTDPGGGRLLSVEEQDLMMIVIQQER